MKLKLPWREPDFETDWTRIVTPMAGGGRGACSCPKSATRCSSRSTATTSATPMCSARCGTARPTSRRRANGDKKNDVRIVKSRKGHFLRFNDGKAKGSITIELNDGKKIEIDDDGIRITDKANTITLDAKTGVDQHRGDPVADAQGAEDHDRSLGLARPQGWRLAERERRHREDQLMGQPAARVGDPTSHGTPLGPGPGAPTVLIGGKPAWRAGSDTHACPLVDGVKPHVGGVVAMGSATVLIGGLPAARRATSSSKPERPTRSRWASRRC